jgi:hypothetical protein
MPPQPLLKICSDAIISFTPERNRETILFPPERVMERPAVAAHIAQCIVCWSLVEIETSRLFTRLFGLGPDFEAGVELYNQFGGASLKENAIKVLARSGRGRACYEIIDALLKVINSQQKTRDKIAHWCWGISDQIPDGLVLVDPKDILLHEARMAQKYLRGDELPSVEERQLPLDIVYVYRVADLQADARAFVELAALVKKCHGLCTTSHDQRFWQLRDELLRDDRLASRLIPSSSEDQ